MLDSTHYEVLVVGAGPAGATLAYQLARAGARVLLLEKEKLPRYKTCGGGITYKAARLLDFDISPVVEQTVTGLVVTNQLGHMFTRRTEQPLIYMVMRSRFDHFLVERAREVGAVVIDGCPVKRIEVNDQHVAVATRDGQGFRAQVLVGADGANSVVARSLGLMRKIPVAIGLESEVRVEDDVLARWQDLVLLDVATITAGYGWIFPKGDHLSIGVGGPAEDSERIRAYDEQFTALCRSLLGQYEVIHRQGHRLPLRPPGAPIHGPRSLLVGDAAGLVNPLDGEGIYYAIRSAQIAAPFILEALGKREVPDFCDYARAVDEQLMGELGSAWNLMRLYNLAPALFVRAFEKSNRLWRAVTRLLRGELRYAELVRRLGPLRWVLDTWSYTQRTRTARNFRAEKPVFPVRENGFLNHAVTSETGSSIKR